MPAHVRIDELEAAVRSVCEPYFTRPLAEISIGEVVVKLFKLAHRYELTIQPQLLLLQKTLLNVEGVGRLLHPKLDIWAVAQPVLADLMGKRYGLNELRDRFRDRLPEILEQAPELPRLLHTWLQQAASGEARSHIRSEDLRRLADVSERGQRRVVWAVIGAALLIAATLLYALEAGGTHWFGQPAGLWIALAGGVMAFVAALRSR
jgi:ubiquinone biosynthesis protein